MAGRVCRRLPGGVLLLLGLCLAGSAPAAAATVVATDCSAAAVQAAIDGAASGDIVVVPNGSCPWSSGIRISQKAIHLKGQSAGGVVITNNSSTPLIDIDESPIGPIRVSLLSFVGGSGSSRAISVDYTPNGRPVLIHDNSFSGSINAIHLATHQGVIWSNRIDTNKLDRSFVHCKWESAGLTPYQAPSTMGILDITGTSNVYVEDNIITRVPLQALDPDDNCRIVIRYNTFDNSAMASHGADTSTVGARHFEVYNNTFLFTAFNDCDGSQTVNLPYLFFIRGGSGVITENVIPNMQSCSWGNKPEIVMTVMNLRRDSGLFPCWNQGWPAPRQVGQGHDGTNPVLERLYIWNNTGGGDYDNPELADYAPNECGGPSATEYLQNGRDFVTGTVKPGYTKYPYPHPLRALSSGTVPTAPTNLRIVTQ